MIDTSRIEQSIENAIIKLIQSGETFKIDYNNRIDISQELKHVYATIDRAKVFARIKELIEEELAQKLVNKLLTEMGTDIKNLMSNATIRDDFKYLLRKSVDDILQKVK
ncbi:MAG: hypothetical protein M0R17_04985 [Candidatus Omnitrophica bacterium]|jgi:hypothetical protein|nr:hypothetical protein [Candidatus Omnitrophota bacterium]